MPLIPKRLLINVVFKHVSFENFVALTVIMLLSREDNRILYINCKHRLWELLKLCARLRRFLNGNKIYCTITNLSRRY